MHPESLHVMRQFIAAYLQPMSDQALRILDVGSLALSDHDTYRPLFDRPLWTYEGADLEPGPNVDIVLDTPYRWNHLATDSFDVVVSGQALEHIAYFWVTAFEIGRVMRPGGLACVIVPSRGVEHRYPLDCWRYYPDGMAAIAAWLEFELLDTHTDWHALWGDSVLVMRKPDWNDEQRARFDERYRLLHAMLPDTASAPPAVALSQAGATGALAQQLEASATPPSPARQLKELTRTTCQWLSRRGIEPPLWAPRAIVNRWPR